MSSKGKGKQSKDSRNTSSNLPSTNEEPENLGFLYSIDALETIYTEKRRPRYLMIASEKGNDIARYWFPPIRAKQFKCQYGNMYRWRAGKESEKLEDYERPEKKFHVASVFFQSQQDNFLAVFKDCTEHDIADEDQGWSQIGFHHNKGLVSQVDIGTEYQSLAAPADGTSWMPQVIPQVYNYKGENLATKFGGQPRGLCGKLSLLIAMAAFSAPVDRAEATVRQCFGYKTWRRHQFDTGVGRYRERGVVVSIYLDPAAKGVINAHLRNFENGSYGPIFGHSHLNSTTQTQQAPEYTYQHTTTSLQTLPGTVNLTPRSFQYTYPAASAPSGFPAATGNTAAGGRSGSQRMIDPSEGIYDAEDPQSDDQSEERGN